MIKQSVFLDTNFLIATQVEKHEFFQKTKELRRTFIEKEYTLYTSPLVLDEFWYVLIGLWKASLAKGASSVYQSVDSKTLYRLLKKATQNILNFKNLILLDLDLNKTEILKTVEIMNKYKLRPRDSIIVEIMKKSKIKQIASFDKDFEKVKGLTVIK